MDRGQRTEDNKVFLLGIHHLKEDLIMKYTVYGHEIELDDELVKRYEKVTFCPVNNEWLECFVRISGVSPTASKEDMVKGIMESFEEEFRFHEVAPKAAKALIQMGVFK